MCPEDDEGECLSPQISPDLPVSPHITLTLALALAQMCPEDDEGESPPPHWTPVKFDAGTARDDDGLQEREIITYSGATQLRWNVRQARAAWAALSEEGGAASRFFGVASKMGGDVYQHMTVQDDLDIVALEGQIVKSLRF